MNRRMTAAILLICCAQQLALASAKDESNKPPIPLNELLGAIRNGTPINNRDISGALLKDAFAVAASQRLKDPSGIILNHCVVTGMFDQLGSENPADVSNEICFRIKCDDTTFLDRFLLQRLYFRTRIEFTKCEFRKDALFRGSAFAPNPVFTDCVFNDAVSFADSHLALIESTYPEVFVRCTFNAFVQFVEAFFDDRCFFKSDHFLNDISFQGAHFLNSCTFGECKFDGNADFNDIDLRGVLLHAKTTFGGDVFVDRLMSNEKGDLQFFETRFKGRFSCSKVRSQLPKLSFNGDFYLRQIVSSHSPCVCEKAASFDGLVCENCDLSSSEFLGRTSFENTRFTELLNLNDALFDDDVDFYHANFPEPKRYDSKPVQGLTGLILDGTKFRKRCRLKWSQLTNNGYAPQGGLKLVTKEPMTFESLERVFHENSDIGSENEAHYQMRLLETRDSDASWHRVFADYISLVFWGYGVRPMRLFLWMLIIFAVFTTAYWTQTRDMMVDGRYWPSQLARLRQVCHFSFRNSLTLFYGFDRSRTLAFKVITLSQSVLSKIMFIILLKAVSNISPLLRDIVGKLIPT